MQSSQGLTVASKQINLGIQDGTVDVVVLQEGVYKSS